MNGRKLSSSATRAALLVAAVTAAAIVSLLGLALGSTWLAFAGLGAAILREAAFPLPPIVTEPPRHEDAEEELSRRAGFLESLIESMRSITGTLDPDEVLERTQREA